MRLDQPLLKLPISFCGDTIADEVRALPQSAWMPHPGNYAGNDAVPLVTPGGQMTNAFTGPMAMTEHLHKCPYIKEVMAAIGAVWGRSRLMGLAPGSQVPAHVDMNYHWRTHMRVHVPVITNPKVVFTVGGDSVHMEPGECWVFDSFQMHNVQNGGTEKRIHLVLDTVGGEALWDLIDQAQSDPSAPAKLCPPGSRATDQIALERFNAPRIMTAWEIRCHVAFIAEHAVPDPRLGPIFKRLDRLAEAWVGVWAQYGDAPEGIPSYQRLIASARADVEALGGGTLLLRNQVPVALELAELVFKVAVPQAPQPALRPAAPQANFGARLAS